MTEMVTIGNGSVSLADWRAVVGGADVRLDQAAMAAVAASAETVAAIVARGKPIYGINTGFGKLASAYIGVDDLGLLQRNLVLSHAAGVGEPTPPAIVRLMMVLKLASLARGASGVRPDTFTLLEAMIARDVIPLVPAQGSVGASGDLAPLAHLAAAMIGIGEVFLCGERMTAASRYSTKNTIRPPTSSPRMAPARVLTRVLGRKSEYLAASSLKASTLSSRATCAF